MIGRETRVLLRHYLERELSMAAVARLAGVSRADGAGGRCTAGSRRDSWTGIWMRSGSGTDRDGPGLRCSTPTRRS